ncbi:unnamed protein product [Bemisia tabaci]|uniref:Serine/threonine-protein kinase 11-interacting protein n=1 Tax=Bemisia tabaci TaxID=7038 RepID=A0A9P0FA98_BEMTA|nr:unnamed protein product [Bemisia tabaci]
MEHSDALISKFISLLQVNGHKVLRGELKLKLTDEFLTEINALLKSHVNSVQSKERKNKIQFLRNFLGNTLKLKINQASINGSSLRGSSQSSSQISSSSSDFTQPSSSLGSSIIYSVSQTVLDLTDFTKLKYLELYKVSPLNIIGYQFLRSQLETIICMRCLNSVSDVLVLDDNRRESSRGQYLWSELRYLVLQHNRLKSVDNSFIYTPWLQFLDLSFNEIKSINKSIFDPLTNLKYLNVSYNFLTNVPTFNMATSRKLQVLLLQHNLIDDLSGLSELENLTCCDLSDNMIPDHSQLNAVSHFVHLETLNLAGNPISYHPRHRYVTCRYLHGNCASSKFTLDNCGLTKQEMDVIHFERHNYLSTSRSRGSLRRSLSRSSSTKRGRTREAVINDPSLETEPIATVRVQPVEEQEAKSVHLETKKKIEIARARYGKDNWLGGQGGSFIQGIMGLSTTPSAYQSESSHVEKQQSSLPINRSHHPQRSSSPHRQITKSAPSEISIVSSDVEQLPPGSSKESSCEKDDSCGLISESNTDNESKAGDAEMKSEIRMDNEDDISVITTEENPDESADTKFETAVEDVDEVAQETSEDLTFCEDFYENKEEEENLLWLIKIVKDKSEEPIFLSFDRHKELKECDMVSGETRTRWTVDTIQSCVKVSSDPVTIQLTFDTLQKHRRERTYIMQQSDATAFLHAIHEELESRSLTQMNQTAFRCIKCSSEFSREKSYAKKPKKVECPLCWSNLVIELDEIPVPGTSSAHTPKPYHSTPIKKYSSATNSDLIS